MNPDNTPPSQPQQPQPPRPVGMPTQPNTPQEDYDQKKQREEANREKACEQLSPQGRKHFSMIEFDEEEVMVTEIRKDPFGLFLIIFTGLIVLILSLVAVSFLSTVDFSSFAPGANTDGIKKVLSLIGILFAMAAVVGTYIGAFLYKNNVIYVTSEKIAQVLYTSIFSRKLSQLSIGDVQDVTVSQKGILPHIFDYGTLVIETAGEQQNYTFSYVPDPYKVSQAIVGAHERNLTLYGN